jgi:pyruvate dehydrogenase E2 component (dihydrolipoamide acetyltransferase)
MAVEIKMPRLSDTMDEGRIVEWRKKAGEHVEEGDVLCVIETDKADVEFQSFYSGTLAEIRVPEGESAPLGEVIAILAEEGEAVGEQAPSGPAKRPAPEKAAPPERPREPEARDERGEAPAEGERLAASPVARRLAEEHGIALDAIEGTGPEGRIVKADVEAAIAKGGEGAAIPKGREGVARPKGQAPAAAPARSPETAYAPASRESLGELHDLSPMRRTIAKRMTESWTTAPHFTVTMRIDMTRAEAFRAEANAADPELGLSLNDLVVAAAARALRAVPAVNAGYEDGKVRLIRDVNVGVAVSVEDGLVTPVIREADRKRLSDISKESWDLMTRGRARKLRPEEYSGGSFTVSNLGMFGVEEFAAIINPPEGAILAVGAVLDTPTVRDGKLQVARVMKVTLSCDHRIIDGVLAARFLGKLRELLENPALLTL